MRSLKPSLQSFLLTLPTLLARGALVYARLHRVQHNQTLTLASWVLYFLVPWWTWESGANSLMLRYPTGIIETVEEDPSSSQKVSRTCEL